jgi:hypothetical protein
MGILGLGASFIFLFDYWRTRPDASWPMVRGAVIERRMVTVGGIATRPHLTIRIEPDGPNVHAVLSMSASSNIPDAVTFRYGGDPAKEVFLEEETSSLTGGLLFLGLVIGLAVVWPFYERYGAAKREH